MREKHFAERFPVYQMHGSPDAVHKYLKEHAREELFEKGAVLLRNTGLTETAQLESLSRELMDSLFEAYTGGTVPRTNHSKYVFSSTELNAVFHLKLHNEMAYQSNYPRYITFFCALPSPRGGRTPIAHESDILRELGGEFAERIAGDNIVYTRRYPSRRTQPLRTRWLPSMFLSWQDAFDTDERAVVEAKCADIDLKASWTGDDTLVVQSVLPAFRKLPENNRAVFFNQLLVQNYSRGSLGTGAYAAHRIFGLTRSVAIRHSAFERGGELSKKDISTLNRAGSRSQVSFTWQRGDWMLLDNLQVQHARKPFFGKRSIWVVMGA
jgi:alpha-ketoglutarate-dependent taurine dioxygenase